MPDEPQAVISPVDVEISRSLADARSTGEVSEADAALVQEILAVPIAASDPAEPNTEEVDSPVAAPNVPESDDIRIRISKMGVSERVKTAIFGNMTARALLIRDPLRLVQLFVLKNPRITPKEIEEFAKNSNLSEQVLRAIANSQTWMRLYSVKLNLVTNPKTPGDISLKWLRHLTITDLRRIAKSKNVPHVVSLSAKKKVMETEKQQS